MSDEITSLLAPAEGSIDFSQPPAGDHGGRRQRRGQDDIDRQARQMACESTKVGAARGGRHISRGGARAARDLGRAQRRRSDRAKRRRSGRGRVRCGVRRQGARSRRADRRHRRTLADATAFDGRIEKDQACAGQGDAGRTASGDPDYRRHQRAERTDTSSGFRRRGRTDRTDHHQARRHRQGRRTGRDRRSKRAQGRPLPILFIGVGEAIEDLQPFVARDFANALVGA